MPINRVSFTLPDAGLREIRGMVYLDEGFLVLKIESAILGILDSEKDVIKIEPAYLDDVRIERGLLRDRLVIEPKRADLLDLIPGEHRGTVELRVWRKYRYDLMRLVDAFDALL